MHIEGDFKCRTHGIGFYSIGKFNEHASEYNQKCGCMVRMKAQKRNIKEITRIIRNGTSLQNRLRRLVE